MFTACVSLDDAVKAPAEANTTYRSADGTELAGYLALPSGDGPHPAVMMVHEWWGLNRDVTILADALAAEGYAVFAPDAFRGQLATSVAAAIAQNRSTPESTIFADLDGALEYLKSHPQVDGSRIATMGFCFGGRQSMYLGIRSSDLAAVITLYGSGLVTDSEELGNMATNGPVLGIFGEDDGSIPLREVEAFGDALDTIGVQNTLTVYPGMDHAFVKSSTYQNDGAAGMAWLEVVGFLDDALR